jgi:hypothetical protein
MNRSREIPPGLDGQSATRALLRARQMAWEIAARTGTPLVIYRDGKIEHIKVAASAGKAPAVHSEP